MIQKVNKTRQILVAFILVAAITGLSSCEKYSFLPPTIDQTVTLHFQTDIQPIFDANCTRCHGGLTSPNLTAAKSYQSLTTGGYVNLPAESSRLYTQIISSGHTARSTDTGKLKILSWIKQGALNN